MQLHSLKSPHSGAAPLETGVCRCVRPTVVSNHTGAHAGVFVWFGGGTASCLCATSLTCSVNEDAGGASFLLFNVLQVILRLVHSAASHKHKSDAKCCLQMGSAVCVCACVRVQRCGPTLENPWRPPLSVLLWCPGWGQRNWGGSPGGCPEWERTGNSGAPLVALLREEKPRSQRRQKHCNPLHHWYQSSIKSHTIKSNTDFLHLDWSQ